MKTLSGAQRRYLRGLANPLKPVVVIGKNGLNAPVLGAIEEALHDHELIKIRFLEFKEEKKSMAQEIAVATHSEEVGMVGHTALFYRQQTDPRKIKIKLPE